MEKRELSAEKEEEKRAAADEDESVEAMVAALFQEDEDDDEEIKQLQAQIQTLAAKAQHYSSNGPALISSRLQSYLQLRRPALPPDSSVQDPELSAASFQNDDDPSIAQAKKLKAEIAVLTEGIPALVQRMKICLEACEKKQRIAEGYKPPLPGFLQDVHKVWESLSPHRV